MKEAEMTWEEFPEAQEWENDRWRWAWRPNSCSSHHKSPDIELVADDGGELEDNTGETNTSEIIDV